MGGLVCAARARELGFAPKVIEKGTRAGGSMLLSSGVVWRHVEGETFRAERPGGDPALQRLGWGRRRPAPRWPASPWAPAGRGGTADPPPTREGGGAPGATARLSAARG